MIKKVVGFSSVLIMVVLFLLLRSHSESVQSRQRQDLPSHQGFERPRRLQFTGD